MEIELPIIPIPIPNDKNTIAITWDNWPKLNNPMFILCNTSEVAIFPIIKSYAIPNIKIVNNAAINPIIIPSTTNGPLINPVCCSYIFHN